MTELLRKRTKFVRVAIGETVESCAEKLNFSPRHWARFESGEMPLRSDVAQQFSQIAGFTLREPESLSQAVLYSERMLIDVMNNGITKLKEISMDDKVNPHEVTEAERIVKILSGVYFALGANIQMLISEMKKAPTRRQPCKGQGK